jgi:cellulase/cellobiase CelA1
VTSCPTGIVVVEWNASTDNVGVAYYAVNRVVGDIATSYTAFTSRIFLPAASGTFSYSVQAFDAAGNRSEGSSLIVGNPNCPPPMSCSGSPTGTGSASPTGPDTQPPSTPGQPVVTVTNGNATITWAPSTDNVGVANYLLYDQFTDVVQIRTLPGNSTTYGVAVGSTQHTFWLYARDAAGNLSPASPRTTVGTPAPCPPLVPCTPTPTGTNPVPPIPCLVSYTVLSQWPGAFQGQVTFRNTRPVTMTGWQLRWAFADGQRITQIWAATAAQTGPDVTATNLSWNANVPPNGAVTFGFIASWTGINSRPSAFTLNGNACGAG